MPIQPCSYQLVWEWKFCWTFPTGYQVVISGLQTELTRITRVIWALYLCQIAVLLINHTIRVPTQYMATMTQLVLFWQSNANTRHAWNMASDKIEYHRYSIFCLTVPHKCTKSPLVNYLLNKLGCTSVRGGIIFSHLRRGYSACSNFLLSAPAKSRKSRFVDHLISNLVYKPFRKQI